MIKGFLRVSIYKWGYGNEIRGDEGMDGGKGRWGRDDNWGGF